MPNRFAIVRTISTSNKGRELRQEVTVDFQGQSVTRHIRNGVGKHPDDTIPSMHRKLEERVDRNRKLQQDKATVISKLSSVSVGDAKGLEKVMKEMALEFVTGLKPKQVTDLLAKLQREIDALKADLPHIEEALNRLRKEDPIMVNFG
jgi:flagellar motility protein MotE (MotC chaperone)